jgi:hypothetical protein
MTFLIRQHQKLKVFLIAVIVLVTVLSFQLAGENNYIFSFFDIQLPVNFSLVPSSNWRTVSVGGGGYVTGIYIHPQQKDLIYIKTDIGGFYRWNSSHQHWIPLTEAFRYSESNYYGGEALALDPNDTNTVYIAVGKYTENWWPQRGAIFKSTNQGKTWTKLNLQVKMGGNEDKRWTGERLAIAPVNPQILLFGSRRDGLWRSSDAGLTWNKVTDFPGNLDGQVGIPVITFDPYSPGRVYASVFGDGMYQSLNNGLTWSKIPGSPSQSYRIVASNNALYVTHSHGISKSANNSWLDITPNQSHKIFNAISINPRDANDILVASGETVKPQIFRSLDGGKRWTEQKRKQTSRVPWWSEFMRFNPWIADIEFDPHISGRVWLTDWYGIWQTNNISANPSEWLNYQDGHEELVIFSLIAPSKGSVLLSGVADVDGFNHNKGLTVYPSNTLGPGTPGFPFQDTYSIAYSEQNPSLMVRVGGNREQEKYNGALSDDGGVTWRIFPSWITFAIPLRVAVSSTNPKRFVVTVSDGPAVQTEDRGKTWRQVIGLPKGPKGPWYWGQPIASDPVDGNTFYYYDNGKVYQSLDGALSFKIVNSKLPIETWAILKTVPGKKGELWVSLNEQGLYYSSDGGISFDRLPSIDRAYLFAFGKAPDHSSQLVLYLYGSIANQGEGLFMSYDRGRQWVKISSSEVAVGNSPTVMEASKQQYGLVFVGTNGRGIYYRSLEASSKHSSDSSSKQ